MSSVGYPDYQRLTQWLGAPIAQATAFALGAGLKTEGPFELANYASVVVAIKSTGGRATVTIQQSVPGGPASLIDPTTFACAAGATVFEAVVLLGAAVTVQIQGDTIGQTVDYAIYGANTTLQASQVSGGTTPTGTILAFAGSIAPSGYVFCDGSTYDGTVAQFSALWGVLGISYGGSGQSAFQVPDLRGRVPVGVGTNAAVNARGLNDGVAVANRRPHHRHTPHVHHTSPQFPIQNIAIAGGASGTPTGTGADQLLIQSADGGSGVGTDSLDAPAFETVNYIIAL